MSGDHPRLPGDTPAGDDRFGPLGGLPDEVHFFVRSRERRADAAGERLARPTTRGDAVAGSPPHRWSVIASRLRRLGRRDDGSET